MVWAVGAHTGTGGPMLPVHRHLLTSSLSPQRHRTRGPCDSSPGSSGVSGPRNLGTLAIWHPIGYCHHHEMTRIGVENVGRPSKGVRIRVGIRFPATLHTLIQREAAERGLTVNDYVIRAVRADMRTPKPAPRRQM